MFVYLHKHNHNDYSFFLLKNLSKFFLKNLSSIVKFVFSAKVLNIHFVIHKQIKQNFFSKEILGSTF